MKIFLVYTKNHDLNSIKIIQSGFSFYAGMFNIFWALYHKLWLVSGITFLSALILAFTNQEFIIEIYQFGQVLFFFLFAEEILSYSYKKLGYDLKDVIYAKNIEEAEYKFIERVSNEQK
jgi:hypothetical protein